MMIPRWLMVAATMTLAGLALAPAVRSQAAEPETPPAVLETVPLPETLTIEELDRQLNEIKDSLCFLGRRNGDSVPVEIDSFLLPNSELAKVSAEWTEVLTIDGKPLLKTLSPEEKAKMDPRTAVLSRGSLKLIDANRTPFSAKGRLHLEIPLKFESLRMTAAELEKPVSSPSFSATLKSCQDANASLQITGRKSKAGAIRLVVRNADGQRIKVQSRSIGRSVLNNDIDVELVASGKIDSVEVLIATETAVRDFPVTAIGAPSVQRTISRYECPQNGETAYVELEAKDLQAKIEIFSGDNSLYGYKPPRMVFTLPPVQNSIRAQVDLGMPELFDAENRPIAYEDNRSTFYPTPYAKEKRFSLPKGSQPPLEFARATGKIKVRYPLKLKEVILTPEHPEAEGYKLAVDGTRISLKYAISNKDTERPSSSKMNLHSYDATGRALRQLDGQKTCQEEERETCSLSFWGEVKKVRFFVVEKWLDLEIPFDQAPVPPKK